MLSKTTHLLATMFSKGLDLLRYPYLNNTWRYGPRENLQVSTRPPAGSPFSDWLTQTVAYHH